MIKLYVHYFIKHFNLLNYKHIILFLLFFYSISTHSQELTNAQPEKEIEETINNSDEIAQHLSEAIQIKTISNQNSSQINSESFVALKENLIKNFPNVFKYLHQEKFSSNSILLKWAINAGVQKHLTFHCFRHTYATLQLNNGTAITTVSKSAD